MLKTDNMLKVATSGSFIGKELVTPHLHYQDIILTSSPMVAAEIERVIREGYGGPRIVCVQGTQFHWAGDAADIVALVQVVINQNSADSDMQERFNNGILITHFGHLHDLSEDKVPARPPSYTDVPMLAGREALQKDLDKHRKEWRRIKDSGFADNLQELEADVNLLIEGTKYKILDLDLKFQARVSDACAELFAQREELDDFRYVDHYRRGVVTWDLVLGKERALENLDKILEIEAKMEETWQAEHKEAAQELFSTLQKRSEAHAGYLSA